MLIEELLKYEEEQGLFELEIRGFHFWHVIRFRLFSKIQSLVDKVGSAQGESESEPLRKRLSLKMNQLHYLRKRLPKGSQPCDILVFNHSRKVKVNDAFEDIYTYPWLLSNQFSSIVLEEPHQKRHELTSLSNVYYLDSVQISVLLRRTLLHQRYFTKSETELITKTVRSVVTHFCPQQDTNHIEVQMIKMLEINRLSISPLRKMIQRVQPKVVLEVVSYNNSRFAINEICDELNIPTIELQHGVMGHNHIAYNFSKQREIKTFPQHLFLFGSFWKETTRFPIDTSRVHVVGMPFNELRRESLALCSKSNEIKTVLFISQGTIGNELSHLAVSLAQQTKSPLRILYKLHPGEYSRWRDEYPWLRSPLIEVIDTNDQDIYAYFNQSDFQVGVYSTALYEGLGFGLPTFILKTFGHQHMEELVSKNQAILIEDASEILSRIDTIERQTVDVDMFWQRDSLHVMNETLSQILHSKESV